MLPYVGVLISSLANKLMLVSKVRDGLRVSVIYSISHSFKYQLKYVASSCCESNILMTDCS